MARSTGMSSLSKRSKFVGANVSEAADRAVAIIISSYPPDLARDAKDYAVALMAHIEQYPIHIIERLCDYKTGIQTRSRLPPTIVDVREFCAAEIERLAEHQRLMSKPIRRPLLSSSSRAPWQCPFPQLAAAFPDRDLQMPFAQLNNASRALAVDGIEAARAILFGGAAPSDAQQAQEIAQPGGGA